MTVHTVEDGGSKTPLQEYKDSYWNDSVEILHRDRSSSLGSYYEDSGSCSKLNDDEILAKYAARDDSPVFPRHLTANKYSNDETIKIVDETCGIKTIHKGKLGCANLRLFDEEDCLEYYEDSHLNQPQHDERLSNKFDCKDDYLQNNLTNNESNSNLLYTDKAVDGFGKANVFATLNVGEDEPLKETSGSRKFNKSENPLCKAQCKQQKYTAAITKNGRGLSAERDEDYQSIQSPQKKSCCSCCGPVVKLVFGVLLCAVGCLSLIWTPLNYFMNERLEMKPGFLPYELWANPPDCLFLKLYMFNITNAESFLNGSSKVLNFTEVGPVIYKEKLSHSNIIFNDNGTMTYTAKRRLEFLPEQNKHIDLNATLVIPNLAVLGSASYIHDSSYFVKQGFNLLMKIHGSSPIAKVSIYNFMWNYTDSLFTATRNMVPGVLSESNMGMLHSIYQSMGDIVTVYIGKLWGDKKFFLVDKVDGSSDLSNFKKNECNDSVQGTSEGMVYSQKMENVSKLRYYRKTLCKVITLDYEDEIDVQGVKALKYTLPENAYDRKKAEDCYAGSPQLPNGLSDVSKCFIFPMATSFPHFRNTDPTVLEKVVGMKPNKEKHASYVIIEPYLGIPLQSFGRSQNNLVVRPLKYFSKEVQLFSNMVLPLFWAEYSFLSLPDNLWKMTVFTVLTMPLVQKVFSGTFLVIGLLLIFRAISQFCNSKSSPKLEFISRNVMITYEKAKHRKSWRDN